ncbi:MAG: radical SAM protein [Microgenomates group bacterium]
MTTGIHILEIEITSRCNLNCPQCYNRGFGIVDLKIQKIIELINLWAKEKIFRLVITGGEPILHPKFDEIAMFIKKTKKENKNLGQVVLQTNGLLIQNVSPENLSVFDIFHLSVDIKEGPREKIAPISKRIEFLKKHGLSVYLFGTIHKGNINSIEKMISLAKRNGVKIGFNILIPNERCEKLSFSPQEYLVVLKKLWDFYRKGLILRPSCPLMALFDKKKRRKKYTGNLGGCTAGIASVVVDFKGDVLPCPFFRISGGNIYKDDFLKIWFRSKIFNQLRDRSKFQFPCGKCEKLSFCGGCRSRAYQLGKSLTAADPFCPFLNK